MNDQSSADFYQSRFALGGAASVAVALPTLIAFNVPPSATLFNQVAALVGWGAFLLLLGAALPQYAWPRSAGARSLRGAFGVLVAAALASSLWAAAPWSLSLSSSGVLLAAAFVATVGACAERAGLGERAFRAFCIGLVVAGVASSAIGLVQVFVPSLSDGDWIALTTLPGRATGNLRQPNHLASLLLWSIAAAVWLGEVHALRREAMAGLVLLFASIVFLTASRTGALGCGVLALWGALDRRLSHRARVALLLVPVVYALLWGGQTLWAANGHAGFGVAAREIASDNVSSSRFSIWSNTLALIGAHPWRGVGFGEFNFAWTLTPFPGRPTEFFDHSHNLPLNFAAELGVPLALLTLALLLFALFCAARNAFATEGAGAGAAKGEARFGASIPAGGASSSAGAAPMQRTAFMIVLLMAVHSLLEYPLWYAYFLLPTAFALGLCLERPHARDIARASAPVPNVTRPYVLAAMALVLGGTLAVYDYMRVVVIFAPPAGAGSLAQRIGAGQRSLLFGHHADYAAGTVAQHPGGVLKAFDRAPHFLLDARLMMAWAKALDEVGDTDRARYLAARLKEFDNPQAEAFFAPCQAAAPTASAPAPAPAPSPEPATAVAAALPFQCLAPSRPLGYEDFRGAAR